MRILYQMDHKNYQESLPRKIRCAARAVILRGPRIAMVKSGKGGYYKFPGGGIEQGETHEQALIREVREETGLILLPRSIQPFGEVVEIRKSIFGEEIFEQHSYYYFAKTSGRGKMNLDSYEEEEQFHLEWIFPETAALADESLADGGESFLIREARTLRLLMKSSSLVGGN